MAEKLFQKGANGLVAEYRCSETLHRLLTQKRVSCSPELWELSDLLSKATKRVASDLTRNQLGRALKQGDALGEYIAAKLTGSPEVLGLPAYLANSQLSAVKITPVGHLTSKDGSADLYIDLKYARNREKHLAVSLKAYRGKSSSLGSKSARASLARMLFGQAKISDEEFTEFFGEPATRFIKLLKKFKKTTKEFYDCSEEGQAFIEDYARVRGTRKVNNPLRRAQVGAYFEKIHGFVPEHEFAAIYADMFNAGFAKVGCSVPWSVFLDGAEFVLGIEDNILTLNAVAGDDGIILEVVNSLTSSAYGMLRATLAEGCDFHLTSKPQSSIVTVFLSNGNLIFNGLTLAVWKDATIQFKITS